MILTWIHMAGNQRDVSVVLPGRWNVVLPLLVWWDYETSQLLLAVMSNSVDGDYVEAGVWRGGTGIFAKGIIDEMAEMDTSKVSRSVHFDAFDLGVQHDDGWLKHTFNKVKPQRVMSWLFWCLEWVMKVYTFTRDIPKIRCQHFIIREKGPASK